MNRYLYYILVALCVCVAGVPNGMGQQNGPQQGMARPTLMERLSPPQVNQKLMALRQRIIAAPLNLISPRDKNILLEAYDHVARTQFGNWILSKADPALNFVVQVPHLECSGYYTNGTHTICLNVSLFNELAAAKSPDERRLLQFRIAGVLAHETTHSIQFNNHLLETQDNSFAEKIVIHRVMELNAMLSETFVLYQMESLPEYKEIMKKDGVVMDAKEAFIREMVDAQMQDGKKRLEAEQIARTNFVKVFWANDAKAVIKFGKYEVKPMPEMVKDWNDSYNLDAFRFFCLDTQSDLFVKQNTGIMGALNGFVMLMGVSLPPAFFLDRRALSFKLPFRQRLMSFYDGKISMVIDAIEAGYVAKSFTDGVLSEVEIHVGGKPLPDGPHTDLYVGTNIPRAQYVIQRGALNGPYREFNNRGQVILEIPVLNNTVNGRGWMQEQNGRAFKIFNQNKVVQQPPLPPKK